MHTAETTQNALAIGLARSEPDAQPTLATLSLAVARPLLVRATLPAHGLMRGSSRSVSPRRSRSPVRRRGSRSRSFSSRSRSRSPARRGGPAGGPPPALDRTIVVSRLTKNVNERHLREIFGVYGQLGAVDLPINRRCA